MSVESDEKIPDDESLESLQKKIEEIERLEKTAKEKRGKISETIDKVEPSLDKVIPDLEGKLNKLKRYRERSTEIKSCLSDKSLSLNQLELLENEILDIEKEMGTFKLSFLEDKPKNEYKLTSDEPVFRPKEIFEPIGESILKNRPIFDELVEEKQLRAYETLLKLGSLKTALLENLYKGTFDVSKIIIELGSNEFTVQKGLSMLVDFGHVSVDRRNLSENAKYLISLYSYIKERAEKEPNYAALLIYTGIILQKRGRPLTRIERYTGLRRGMISEGAELLNREHLIKERRLHGEPIYFGDTRTSMNLLKSIHNSYRTIKK